VGTNSTYFEVMNLKKTNQAIIASGFLDENLMRVYATNWE